MNLIPEVAAFTLMLAVAVPGRLASQGPPASAATPVAHTRTEFRFTVDAPFEQVAPLFGAHEERTWSEGWDPEFIYPNPARDQQGMVFKVAHGQFSSVWVNTAFDLAAGHIQYAYVLNDAMVTTIDIHLTRECEKKTGVAVVYERTALMAEANGHVQHFAKGDEGAGKEWGDAINAYFAKLHTSGSQK